MSKLICVDFNEFKTYEGDTMPVGDWVMVTQDMINAFAEGTQDYQWIHIDVERSKKESPFKKTIAHGFLSVSLLSKLLADVVVIKSNVMGVNYGLNKVRFPKAVLVDSRLRLHSDIHKIEDYGEHGVKVTWNCSVEIEREDKPACVAEVISLLFER